MNRFDSQEALDPYKVIPRIASGELKFIRQSMTGSADVCLRRLGYDLTGRKGTGEARIVGTAYHAGQEARYRARMAGETATKARIHQAAAESFEAEAGEWDGWATTKLDAARRVVDMLDAYDEGGHEWGPEYKVLGVEQEWFLPLVGDWAIKGTIDLVLRGPVPGTDQVGVILDDHKTAGKKWPKDKHNPRKQPQPALYSWAWWSCTGILPARFVYEVMAYDTFFERRWTAPTEAHLRAWLDKVVALCELLDATPDPTLLPANTSSNLCSARYCDHWAICPMGAALELPTAA